VDDLSDGRLQFGLGAGWQAREHHNYSWDLLGVKQRMDRFEEGLEVITRMLHSGAPVTFEGEYYQVYDAVLLPRPQRPGGPPIVIGGNGPKRTLPLVAKYADEWNSIFLPAKRFRERSSQLDELVEMAGRSPADVRRSMMTGVFFGYDEAEVVERAARRGRTPEEARALGAVFGTASQIVDHLGELQEAGLQRIMLQWLDLDDLDRLADMAKAILPHFS
jgi:alkanesulfonate monooxygenase SsuD/methylene tetrahydromethanopterin reductase-like flavin-dependent oxidoreductase (luciferase family)